MVPLILSGGRAYLQLGQEAMGWDMVVMVVPNFPNVWPNIYKSRCQIIVIPVVNFLYQDCTHTACKHNFIYNSVYIKNGARQFQQLLHLPTVTFCWWPAVNKAVSPCCLNTVFIKLLLEHPVQLIHKTVDGKTKGFKRKICFVHNL